MSFTYQADEDLSRLLNMTLTAAQQTSVLVKQAYGLGDAVQLTCVLQHLAKHHPDWVIDVATGVGKHSAFDRQCRRALVLGRDPIDETQYRQVFDLGWYECYSVYSDSPCTKVCNCLREVFGIDPEPALLKYRIATTGESRRKTRDYLGSIRHGVDHDARFPVVAVHYQGNTSADKKNLPHELVAQLCRELLLHGYVPLILDWDRRSPLPDQTTIFCPGVGHDDLWHNSGTGDAARLAALLAQCALVIGVDSGPLHVAGATDTPTLGVWTGHSPVQFYDLCPNVTHLVPQAWRSIPPCQNETAARYFEEHYAFRTYDDLETLLLDTAFEILDGWRSDPGDARASQADCSAANRSHESIGHGNPQSRNDAMLSTITAKFFENPRGYGFDYYLRNKAAGLDLLDYSAWQRRYGRWLVEVLGLADQRVLDVGCACGSTTRGLRDAGALPDGVDCSELLIQLGREQWPDMAGRLFVGDAVNLHFIADDTYDWLHSCIVAEHWNRELVPFILAELRRIVKPGGSFYCSYESGSIPMPDGRNPADEPTRLCLKPAAWWDEQLVQAGWELVSSVWAAPLYAHPDALISEYPWAWFVARKPN